MDDKFNKTIELLKKYNQEHLLQFYHLLNEDKQSALINEILAIDFELIQSTYNHCFSFNVRG